LQFNAIHALIRPWTFVELASVAEGATVRRGCLWFLIAAFRSLIRHTETEASTAQ
jgi:hypothetical protein